MITERETRDAPPHRVGLWHVGVVVSTAPQTPTGRSIVLDVPGWGGNLAGQHADVRLTAPDGYQAVRSYSIASAGETDRVELAVDRFPDGEVSPYLVDDLAVGDQVELRGPLGGWFVWTPAQTEPVQLIGGGSGIVPLMAMIRSHADSASAAPFRLLYSLRSPGDAFFRSELETPTPGLDVTWLYTRGTPAGLPRAAGRITPDDLAASAFPPSISPAVFVCGPTGFVETVANALVALGHDPHRVKTERFGGA
ncbi:ferredoxin reductase [Lacisediminihabitans profunda]|uniref:ferredoxin reductase n=1 Tax=Lacisediminihabitans profunda TaxID=2594790 RepID=UPI001FE96286|nr:ferredoxin reductase [Lacisediminihabitans profunda]